MKQLNKITGEITAESEFCQKIDRILSGDTNRVVRHNKNVGIAGANGKQILINFDNLKDETKGKPEQEIVLIKGINFHENSHVDFTIVNPEIFTAYPRARPLALQNLDYSLMDKARVAFNILEDARIENLQIAKYPVLKRYFSFCVQQLILSKSNIFDKQMKGESEASFKSGLKEDARNCFLLTYGRKFIDRKLVKEYESLCDFNNLKKIKIIFNEFNVTTEKDKQLELCVSLAKLLIEENTNVHQPKGQREYRPEGEGKKSKQHSAVMEQLKKDLKEALKNEKALEATDEEGERAGERAGEGAGKSKTTKTNKNKLENIENTVKKIKEQIKTGNEEILEALSETIIEDLKTVNSLRRGEGYNNKDGYEETTEGITLQPNNEDLINSVKLKQLLRKLRNGLQASYIREQKAGKIDIRRAITQRGRSAKIFKKFQPNRLGRSKLGVSILLDSSGSMGNSDFEKLMRMAWSIDKALNECGDKDIVLEYSTDFKILKTLYGRKGNWERHFDGGTDPTDALKTAYSQLLNLRRTDNVRTNIVLLFSDGYFHTGDDEVKRMNQAGMHTIFIAPNKSMIAQHGSHNCREAVAIENTGDFEKALERVIVRVHRDIHKQRCIA